jgi:hypothetical protein
MTPALQPSRARSAGELLSGRGGFNRSSVGAERYFGVVEGSRKGLRQPRLRHASRFTPPRLAEHLRRVSSIFFGSQPADVLGQAIQVREEKRSVNAVLVEISLQVLTTGLGNNPAMDLL